MSDSDLAARLEFAVDAAREAGRITRVHFRAGVRVERKADDSPVTVADRAAERRLRELLADRFPEDGVLGEEFGATREGARHRWILDPIDGTRTFVRGVPLYGTLVALETDGAPVLGVIHLPALDETVWAADGLGCWWNGSRARVSAVADLGESLVLATNAEHFAAQGCSDAWDRLRARAGMTRTWGDCYGYALVATGRAEAMLDPVLAVWDAAAVVPVIREAGGVVTDFAGRERHDGGSLVATNAALSEPVRRTMGGGS